MNRHIITGVLLALAIAALWILALEFRSLRQLEALQAANAGSAKPSMEAVFSFPQPVCAPKPAPLVPKTEDARTPTAGYLASLARSQFLNGLVLSACLLGGLVLGAALTYRAASRETRLAHLKSAFVSHVSHEMKTPLALIRMFAETLEMGRVSDPARLRHYYVVIRAESQRLTKMIEDLLDFQRMEEGARQYRFVPYDAGDVIRAAVASLDPVFANRGFEVALEIEKPLPAALDPKAINQALTNLLMNAVEYSGDSREISVSGRMESGTIAITVADKGIGIAMEEQTRVFEKFYRAESSEGLSRKGAGLGLAIARHVVQAHGGEIQLESHQGSGSRFTIRLPARPAAMVETQSKEEHGAPLTETADHRG
jgi:signal transduction histidine kinase